MKEVKIQTLARVVLAEAIVAKDEFSATLALMVLEALAKKQRTN